MDAGYSLQMGGATRLPFFVAAAQDADGRTLAMTPHASTPEAVDAEILSRVARGDLDAFGQFYDRHAPVLFSLALKILRDHHEAEEALQEAMALIWERAGVYDAALGKPFSWAVTITRNKAIDRLRSVQRKSKLIAEAAPEIEETLSNEQVSARAQAVAGDAAEAVRRALNGLPQEQRRAIELAFFGGLTHTEISEKAGVPLGTTKGRIRRGMLALRDALEGLI